MANMDIGKSAKLAGLFTAAVWAVNLLMQKVFASTVTNLFALSYPSNIPSPVNPVSATVGGKVVSWLGGYLPGFDVGVLFTIFLSALVAIVIGQFLVGQGLPAIKGRVGGIASVILWGTIPLYLIFVGTAIPGTSVLLGVLIYTFVASYATAFIADLLKIQV